MAFVVVIPARFASSRLPGKPLADINGKTMIERVYQQALQSGAGRVVVATDDRRVADVVDLFGGEVCMTKAEHNSGTERLAEVVSKLQLSADTVVVNVQGDEPLIDPELINQVARVLQQRPEASMSTAAHAISQLVDFFLSIQKESVQYLKLVKLEHGPMYQVQVL